jgi:hypothetical protein
MFSRILRLSKAPISTSSKAYISPVLLRRARSIAEEHERLSTQNAENYDSTRAKKIGELSSVTAALAEWDAAQNVSALPPPTFSILPSPDIPFCSLFKSSILSFQTQPATLR